MIRYRRKAREAFTIGFIAEKENTDFKELIFLFDGSTSKSGIISERKIKRMKNGNLLFRRANSLNIDFPRKQPEMMLPYHYYVTRS